MGERLDLSNLSFFERKFMKKIKKVIPFILITVVGVSSVLGSYKKASSVNAVAVVDDLALFMGLMAMCGVTYTAADYYWSGGQWFPDSDSPIADPDTVKWGEGLNTRLKEKWDEDVRQKGIELGYLDSEGNIINSGGSGSGSDDDNNNKFPDWDSLKALVKKSDGNIAIALGALTPLIGFYGYDFLYESGSWLADKTIADKFKIEESYVNGDTIGIMTKPYASYLGSITCDTILVSATGPVCTYNGLSKFYMIGGDKTYAHDYDSNVTLDLFLDGTYVGSHSDFTGYVSSNTFSANGKHYKYYYYYLSPWLDKNVTYNFFCPNFNNEEDCVNYLKFCVENGYQKYFNPESIDQSTDLKNDINKDDNGNLIAPLPVSNYGRIPTSDEITDFYNNIKNLPDDSTEDDRLPYVDNLISTLTTPDPDGDSDSDPDGGTTPDPDGDSDSDSTNKEDYLKDLRYLFPFCVPFDLVDCFKLFNADPVTPKVEFPIHFGIVEKDYTFVIDLKDFNGVASVCRAMFLITFIWGLILATRHLIRG